jgi:2',3'-cyclic-nucleotide 2'-phosphodiesterase/3'-nucleotidase
MTAHGEVVEVTLFHTTDLHGHLAPTTDYEGNRGVGGMYQLATVLQERRSNCTHTILVDNGDSLQGTLLNYEARGHAMVDCLNALDCAVWNIGNHEFDWGVELLGENIARFSNAIVGANLHWAGAPPSPFARVQPFVIRELGGMRIAVVGVTHPKIPYWSRAVLLRDAVVEAPLTAMLRVMPQVRAAKPDAIVVLAHMGSPDGAVLEDPLRELVTMFPDIDVVIGGHTHTAVPSLLVGRTLFSEAAYHGITLGEIKLTFDRDTRRLLQSRAILVPIGPRMRQDRRLRTVTRAARAHADAVATQPLCRIAGVLGGAPDANAESSEQTLLCTAIACAVKADVVFHGAFESPCTVSNRVMTVGDLFQFVPYENRIVVGVLSPAQIGATLDSLCEWWDTPLFAFPYGLKVRADVNATAGERILALKDARGKPLVATNRYRVAFNSYMAASGGQRYLPLRALLEQRAVQTADVPLTTRDAVAQFLRAQGVYTPVVVRTVLKRALPTPVLAVITPTTPLRPGALRFAELAYMHPGNRWQEQAGEWFVVKNNGTTPANLKGYVMTDTDEGGAFRITKDLLLAPQEVMVFCHTIARFRTHPYAQNPYLRLFEYGPLAGRLNLGNRGDELILVDPQGNCADQIVYGQHIAKWPAWPADSKTPNHKIGESVIKRAGGWEVNGAPLSEW